MKKLLTLSNVLKAIAVIFGLVAFGNPASVHRQGAYLRKAES